MKTYLALFIISLCCSLVLTPLLRRLCERFGWLDVPRDGRRVHQKAVPRLGGVAIFASLSLAMMFLPFVDNLLTQSLRTSRSQWYIVLVPAMLMLLFGVYDDLRGANARLKFLVQALVGILFYVLGGRINALSVPFVGSVELPMLVGLAITVLWTIGITNAFNLIDGMDGLAAGAALFSSLVILVVSLILGNPLVTVTTLVLCGALIGFLRYNFNPASIFLGDSGSLFIGFTLAALSVQGTQKASTAVAVAIPLLAFGLPVVDTGFTLVRRMISRKPLFEGDREHIHHMLLARGWSQRRVVLVLYGVCAIFGLLAMFFVQEFGRTTTGLVLFVIGAAVVLAVGRLRYHELDEIKASMKRNLGDRRLRAANNIHLRRASREMSHARTLADILKAVEAMLEPGEFVFATMQLGSSSGRGALNVNEEIKLKRLRGAEIKDGQICWSWERGDIEAGEIVGSGRFWTLRLPLSTEKSAWGYINLYREFGSPALQLDINYLCGLFQREMSRAVERVLSEKPAETQTIALGASFKS